jgi:putative hydrolase of the HAD superfamily
MAIKAIFFDAAGTLIKPARRVGESYASVAAKYGIPVAAAEIAERFRFCFDASPPLAFPGADESAIAALERQWWRELVVRVLHPWAPFDRFDEYFAELFQYFAGSAAWTLYPEVAETLAILKQRGLVLDVISNFDSRLFGILSGLGIADFFDGVFVSTRVGYAKPDRRIFEAALRAHGLEPHEALHVGDSLTHDVGGARDAGMEALLVDRAAQTDAPVPRKVVTSLTSVVAAVQADNAA